MLTGAKGRGRALGMPNPRVLRHLWRPRRRRPQLRPRLTPRAARWCRRRKGAGHHTAMASGSWTALASATFVTIMRRACAIGRTASSSTGSLTAAASGTAVAVLMATSANGGMAVWMLNGAHGRPTRRTPWRSDVSGSVGPTGMASGASVTHVAPASSLTNVRSATPGLGQAGLEGALFVKRRTAVASFMQALYQAKAITYQTLLLLAFVFPQLEAKDPSSSGLQLTPGGAPGKCGSPPARFRRTFPLHLRRLPWRHFPHQQRRRPLILQRRPPPRCQRRPRRQLQRQHPARRPLPLLQRRSRASRTW